MSATTTGIPGRVAIHTAVYSTAGHREGTIEVEATIYGSLAVTPSTRNAFGHEDPAAVQFADDRWTVTHIPSGRYVVESWDRAAVETFAARWGAHKFWVTAAPQTPFADWPAEIVAEVKAVNAGRWER